CEGGGSGGAVGARRDLGVLAGGRQRVDQLEGVRGGDLAAGDGGQQQQRPGEMVGVDRGGGPAVALGVERRRLHVALAVRGVDQGPVGERRHRGGGGGHV